MGYTKLGLHKGTGHTGTGTVCVCECVCVFNSIKKTLIIPQGAILLSWQAHNFLIFFKHEVNTNRTVSTNTTPPTKELL